MATLNQLSFAPPETFDCPTCRMPVKLYDPDGSEFCVCPSCHSFLRFIASNHPKSQRQVAPIKEKPIIPLGSEGTLKGFPFKVIAYMEKRERGTDYTWKEYLLYNFAKGYATLAEFNGHWNFIVDEFWEPTLAKAFSDSRTATHQQMDYRIFNKYTPQITGLVGEFDWDVLADSGRTHEYIAPPFILSKEVGPKKTHYYWGEYTDPEEITAAFGLDPAALPAREGIGANQPSKYGINFEQLAKISVLAVLGMLLLYFIIRTVRPERELLDKDFSIVFDKGVADDYTGRGTYEFKPFVTSSFQQPDSRAALEVAVDTYIDNNWLEATVILVNETTNETWEVTKAAEFYHGYEGGESWSEGSRRSTIILTGIPQGKYHLNIYPASGDANQTSLHIRVTSNITLWRNILLAIAAMSIYPIFYFYRSRTFEKRRWWNSDYSPFHSD